MSYEHQTNKLRFASGLTNIPYVLTWRYMSDGSLIAVFALHMCEFVSLSINTFKATGDKCLHFPQLQISHVTRVCITSYLLLKNIKIKCGACWTWIVVN